jgi:nucleoside 2-deoxyribosyltransferase
MLVSQLMKRDIIQYNLTDEQFKIAHKKAEFLKDKFNYDDTFQGSLGETTFERETGLSFIDESNYDFILPNGDTIDVKTNTCENGIPNENFTCKIYRIGQNTKYLVFYMVSIKRKLIWIMGYILKDDFLSNCNVVEEGKYFPDGSHIANRKTYLIKAKYLTPWKNFRKDFCKMSERWKIRVYLAGWSNDVNYRKEAIEKYGNLFDFVDPMCITWEEVNQNVNKNVNEIWLVKRDKKLIDSCEILVAHLEYLQYGEIMIGTLMEIMYAYDHGIPIFLISSEDKILNNAWLRFHYKKGFKNVEECFNYLGGK